MSSERSKSGITVEGIDSEIFPSSFETGFGLRSLIDAKEGTPDSFQLSLRPKSLEDYVGQPRVRENMSIAISAAKRRGEALDHVLLYGPPGLGKTSLAQVVANELGVSFKGTAGPVLEKPGDLAAILSSLNEGDVLFIDEIHRLNRMVEEILYPALEDYQIDIIIGHGPAARSIKLNLKPFTLIAATTRVGMLTAPLRNRFGIVERLEFYSDEDLERILLRSAQILQIPVDQGGAKQIAKRSRGTPRIANRLLKRARDFAEERADSIVTEKVADQALNLLDIDQLGLDRMDRALLLMIVDKFGGGPVGVETLAAALSEDRETIEDVYEPFLLQQGFLQRTPRGREATALAYRHLNRSIPSGVEPKVTPGQFDLFD